MRLQFLSFVSCKTTDGFLSLFLSVNNAHLAILLIKITSDIVSPLLNVGRFKLLIMLMAASLEDLCSTSYTFYITAIIAKICQNMYIELATK